MGDSYVEKKSDIMHRLLWDNILEEFVSISLPAIPYIGIAFANPIVNRITMWFVDKYLAKPLFLILTRWGVFTSVDWKEAKIYNAFEKEAEKLIPLQEKETWDEEDHKTFKAAARRLIVYSFAK